MSRCSRLASIAALSAGCVFGQALEGKVVEDHSNRPLPSVLVRVREAGKTGLIADLETSPEGRFHAPGLPPGEYQIEVSKPSFATSGFRLRIPAAPVMVRLVRYGAITGRVTDAQGRPTRGASVWALTQTAGGPLRRVPLGFGITDDRGQYRIFNLPPGRYAAAVSWASNNAATAGAYLYPDNSRPEMFVVAGGDEYRVDFAMPQQATFSISGKAESQLPVFLGLVAVEQPGVPVAIRFTGRDGNFRIEGLIPGSYELMASSTTFAFGAAGGPTRQSVFGRTRVEVSQNVEGVTVALQKGRTVRFMLRAANAEAAGACPASATIVLWLLENFGDFSRGTVEATTAKEAAIDDLPPGLYQVSAEKLGDTCFLAPSPILDLRTAGIDGPVTVSMTAAGALRGKLAGAARPRDFVVVLVAAERGEGAPQPLRMSFPDTEGAFAMSGLPPGRYKIVAKPAAEASSTRWVADLARMIEIEVLSGLTELELPVTTGVQP